MRIPSFRVRTHEPSNFEQNLPGYARVAAATVPTGALVGAAIGAAAGSITVGSLIGVTAGFAAVPLVAMAAIAKAIKELLR